MQQVQFRQGQVVDHMAQRARHATAQAQHMRTMQIEHPEQFAAQLTRHAATQAHHMRAMQTEDPEQFTAQLARHAASQAQHMQAMQMEHPEQFSAHRRLRTDLQRQQRQYMRTEQPQIAAAQREHDAAAVASRIAMRKRKARDITRWLAKGNASLPDTYQLGLMDHKCKHCGALHFEGEERAAEKNTFHSCCNNGKVVLEKKQPFPDKLEILFPHRESEDDLNITILPPPLQRLGLRAIRDNFTRFIRHYNGAIAFASVCADVQAIKSRGPPVYKVHGQIYHYIGPLRPQSDNTTQTLSFGELYFIDTAEAVSHLMQNIVDPTADILPDLLEYLDTIIREINPLAKKCMQMREIVDSRYRNVPNLQVYFHQHPARRLRAATAPTAAEIAAVYSPIDETNAEQQFYILRRDPTENRRELSRLFASDKEIDPMCYPLLFPTGEHGWHYDMTTTNVAPSHHASKRKQRISMREYITHIIADRGGFNALLRSNRLFQQYIVDAFVRIERMMLQWQRHNQKKLRVDTYKGLHDYLLGEAADRHVKAGKVVVLSSSFPGSPRHMNALYLDAMAICQTYGSPDYFITFTCNPQWSEITSTLLSGQTPADRPDVVATVFQLKLSELINDIVDKHILGKVLAYTYTIEFQKRGLPHSHILIILADDDKIRDCNVIDDVISAEIPDKNQQPVLYKKVKSFMIHGPCGHMDANAPCMAEREDGRVCIRNFPKLPQPETCISDNAFPKYRRRCVHTVSRRHHDLSDQWVVPYNPYLLCKFDAHINVELCASINSYKYIYKYIFKMPEEAIVEFHAPEEPSQPQLNLDEIAQYERSRFVTSSEAAWRLFSYPLHDQSHTVQRLAVHEPQEEDVIFQPGEEQLAMEQHGKTTLTAWFRLNECDTDARKLRYMDIPSKYVFDKKTRTWQKRRRASNVVARLCTANPKTPERFYLRMLLLYTPGAIGFEDLRTVKNTTYNTFMEACVARELITTDSNWRKCLQEASQWQMPYQLRELLATLITWSKITTARQLFDEFHNELSEDHAHQLPPTMTLQEREETATSLAWDDINDILKKQGHSGLANIGFPRPAFQTHSTIHPPVPQRHIESNLELDIAKLNEDQRRIYDDVISAVKSNDTDRRYFVDGPGGTGKTFLYTIIIRALKSMNKSCICVAWTGIASLLLPNGTTVHNRFKLPLSISKTTVLNIKGQSQEADDIRNATAILWDEATMASGIALDTIDKGIRDIINTDKPFGGKLMLLGGDFRQVLPVIPGASRSYQILSSIKYSKTWHMFEIRHLRKNMRTNPDEIAFARWILRVGNGELGEDVKLPKECVVHSHLIDKLFGAALDTQATRHFTSTVILAPTNKDCDSLNEDINDRILGKCIEYRSVDVVDDEHTIAAFPTEFLNRLDISGMPPHLLKLKKGSIVMLLRNLNIDRGLCNGVRMLILDLQSHVLYVELLTGERAGTRCFIPRIKLQPSPSQLPIPFTRTQFPIRLAFAMTINKAQGQTFERVGISLLKPVFGHGQLYVALSRVRSQKSLYIQLPLNDYTTKNIVYKEALEHEPSPQHEPPYPSPQRDYPPISYNALNELYLFQDNENENDFHYDI